MIDPKDLPPLWVKTDEPGYVDGLRPARPEEVGATRVNLMAGAIKVHVGQIVLIIQDDQNPGSNNPHSFLIGRDATMMIDGKSYQDRTGLRLKSIELKVEAASTVTMIVEGMPRS